jgi:hypothetical protein
MSSRPGSKTCSERTACRSNASSATKGGPANSTNGVLAGGNGLSHERTSLLPLFDLAAAVDDERHLLAVFHRLDGRTFGCRFDVSDLNKLRQSLGCEFVDLRVNSRFA